MRCAIPQRIAASNGLNKLSKMLIWEFRSAIAHPGLKGKLLVLLAWARALSREATWFEGCSCHQYILDDKSVSLRVRLLRWRRATKNCIHKGRRALDMITHHVAGMLERFSAVTCAELTEHLENCRLAERKELLVFKSHLDTRLCARFRHKFDFLFHPPYVFLAGVSRDIEMARRFVRRGLEEVQLAIANGREHALDNVTVRLAVGSGNLHAQAMQRFGAGTDHMLEPGTLVLLRDYGLAKVVSRLTEAQHAYILMWQKKCTNMSVVLLNVKLKLPELRQSLQVNADFWNFCVLNWRRRNLVRR